MSPEPKKVVGFADFMTGWAYPVLRGIAVILGVAIGLASLLALPGQMTRLTAEHIPIIAVMIGGFIVVAIGTRP